MPSKENVAVAAKALAPRPMKITETYARTVAGHLYFSAWPMVNIYNRRLAFDKAPEQGLMNGIIPLAPRSYAQDILLPANKMPRGRN